LARLRRFCMLQLEPLIYMDFILPMLGKSVKTRKNKQDLTNLLTSHRDFTCL